jgi:hypothetical protein
MFKKINLMVDGTLKKKKKKKEKGKF